MKPLAKLVLTLYLLALLWLILFKFSFDVSSVLSYQMRSLSLIPFVDFSRNNSVEIILNLVVFIPLGLLLSVVFTQTDFWRKLAFVLALSVCAEAIQFVFAIGTTDITDVIMNTAGGFLGLALYALINKYVDNARLNRFIIATSMILLVGFISLRVLVFKVNYHSTPTRPENILLSERQEIPK